VAVIISDSLARRRALVTGGIKAGAAIADRLTEGGATVMTTARTMPDSCRERCPAGCPGRR
jgi:NAD(P)-dependent dehydrogenase (short-subunit alcohol dehydrogenase family)